jgi:hypothetical protein
MSPPYFTAMGIFFLFYLLPVSFASSSGLQTRQCRKPGADLQFLRRNNML